MTFTGYRDEADGIERVWLPDLMRRIIRGCALKPSYTKPTRSPARSHSPT